MTFSTVYTLCFVLGVSFVLASLLLGHAGHGQGHGHAGGHGHADHADGHSVGLPLFSPTVIAVFVGMFGAGGLLLREVLGWTAPLLHLAGAAAISLVSGLGVAFAMMKLLEHGETNSLSPLSELAGREVEVSVAILGSGLGEVAFEAAGTRQTTLAQSVGGIAIPLGARVRVVEVKDGIARVVPASAVAAGSPESVGVPVKSPRSVR